MKVCGRSLFKCLQKLRELAPDLARQDFLVSQHMQEEVPVCIEPVLLGARIIAQALELGPGTSSIFAVVCVRADLLAIAGAEDAVGHPLQLFQRCGFSIAVKEGPLSEAGRARLGMPDEVVLVGLLAGIALPMQRLSHIGI